MKNEKRTFPDKKKGKGKLPTQNIEGSMPTIEKYNTDRLMAYVRRLMYFFGGIIVALLASNAYFAYGWYREAKSEVTYFVDEDETRIGRKVTNSTKHRSGWEIENFSEIFLDKTFCHTPGQFYQKLKGAVPLMTAPANALLVSILRKGGWATLFNEEGGSSHITIDAKSIEPDLEAGGWKVVLVFQTTFSARVNGKNEVSTIPMSMVLHLRPVPRSKNNPYGLLVNEFKLAQNK